MPAAPTVVTRAMGEVAPRGRAIAWSAAAALVWSVWVSGPGWATPAVAVAACASAALFVIDARTHRLPNAITYPATAVVAGLLVVAALGSGAWDALLRAALAALVLGGAYLLLHLASPRGMGLGDVKLAVLLGLVAGWFGWPELWATALLPFLIGGLVAVVLIVARRASGKSALAFGPYMITGAALALTWSRLGLGG